MKRFILIALVFIGLKAFGQVEGDPRYTLVWSEEFDSPNLNEKVWSKIPRSEAEWAVNMTPHDSLFAFVDGNIVLRGVKIASVNARNFTFEDGTAGYNTFNNTVTLSVVSSCPST